jgi:hypothetical protein
MAVWAEPGDTFAFYEISSADIRIARDPSLFTFLSDCKGTVEIREGDGRKVLEAEDAAGAPGWDVLEIDAFSGDAIPLQLISDEAFDLFRRRLAPGGILSIHVSNWQFDLLPVMKRQMERLGFAAVATIGPENGSRYLDETIWVHYSHAGTAATAQRPAATADASSDIADGGDVDEAESDSTAKNELFSLFPSLEPPKQKKPEPTPLALGDYTLVLPPRAAQIPWDRVPDGPAVTDAKGSLLPLMTDKVRDALFSF